MDRHAPSPSVIAAVAVLAGLHPSAGQSPSPSSTPTPPPPPSPAALVSVQEPPKVVPRVLDRATPENTKVTVSLGRQRAYLLVDGEVAIDTPVSTGKRRSLTPSGDYEIIEKLQEHRSHLYGDFIGRDGAVVRAAASARIDTAPGGTTFREVPVLYYMQLTPEGLALHAGRLPGYPAADASVRLPQDIAPLIFQRVKKGTPVKIED